MATIKLDITAKGSTRYVPSKAATARDGMLTYHMVEFLRGETVIAASQWHLFSKAKAKRQAITRLNQYLRANLPT